MLRLSDLLPTGAQQLFNHNEAADFLNSHFDEHSAFFNFLSGGFTNIAECNKSIRNETGKTHLCAVEDGGK